MANSTLVRNLRDGQITVIDGSGTPKTSISVCDEGDLSWTENKETKEIKCRGVLNQTRPGDQMSCDVSFSAKLTQLIMGSVSGTDWSFYEMFNQLISTIESTSGDGEQFTLKIEFLIADPAGGVSTDEKITFSKVFQESLEVKEGDEFDSVSFKGKHFGVRPVISRV